MHVNPCYSIRKADNNIYIMVFVHNFPHKPPLKIYPILLEKEENIYVDMKNEYSYYLLIIFLLAVNYHRIQTILSVPRHSNIWNIRNI